MPRRPNIIQEVPYVTKQSDSLAKITSSMVKVGSVDSVSASDQSETPHQATRSSMEPGITGGAKITGSGGGRKRKQAKPIRMNFDLDTVEVAPVPIMPRPERLESSLVDDADHEMASLDMDDIQSALQCDLCDDRFDNQGDLSDHVQSVHNLSNQPEGRDRSSPPVAFPTKYHMLGSQFLEHETAKTIVIEPQDPDPLPPSPAEQRQYSPPAQVNEDSRNSDGQSSPKSNSSKSATSRIFHKDAFCDLCDREFCNKYFLKTHLANKHGIYDGSPVPNGSSQVNGNSSAINNSNSTNGSSLLSNMIPLSNSSSFTATSVMGATVSVGHHKTSPPPTKVVTPPALSLPQPVITAPRPPPKPAEHKSSKPSGPDMEDYCEICQKHFCNKYYLRKHKQDVHGIIPDTPPTKRSRSNNNASSAAANNPPSSLPTPLNIPHPGLAGSGPSQAGLNGMPNLMFLNPFAPPLALLQGQQPSQGLLPGGLFPAGLLPPGLQMPPGLAAAAHGASEPGLKTPTSSTSDTSPPSTGASASESLRNMGILNNDAYCELCRKEFCNKYFLQIHKANKHGIIDEDLALPGAGGLLMPNFPLPEGLKLPENLKMHEGMKYPDMMKFPENMKLPEGLKFPDALKIPENMKNSENLKSARQESDGASSKDGDSRSDAPTPNGSEKSDKSENQKMASIMDMKPDFKMFGATSSIEELKLAAAKSNEMMEMMRMAQASGLPLPPGFDGGMPLDPTAAFSSSMFGNMIAAKLADRVVCDICNKEVCNKYFLKTHKLKVHGVDPASLENENSNPSTPLKKLEPLAEGPTDLSNKSNMSDSPPSDHKVPNEGELLKMGIDPEAYCEICKKEFCSKYFLKTHKLNIHGIKVDSIPDGRSKPSLPGSMFSSSAFTPSMTTITSSPLSHAKPPPPMPSAFSFLPVAPPLMSSPEKHGLTPSMVPTMAPGVPGGLGEQRTWKWKEPVNATRVMCDLCNKELCNKYFLKTHMLNKHGIHWDVSTGQPIGPANTTTSTAPSSKVTPTSAMNKPLLQTPPVQSQVNCNGEEQATDLSLNKGAVAADTPTSSPKIFENKEPSIASEAPPKNGVPKPELTTIVSAKTWQVPQEYRPLGNNGKKSVPTPEGTKRGGGGGVSAAAAVAHQSADRSFLNGDPFIRKCDICGLLFGEPVTLQLHKMQDHKIAVSPSPNFSEANRSSLANAYGITLRKKYQRRKLRSRRWRRLGAPVGTIGEKVKSAIMNHLANHQRRKKYRCAHCQERFLSKTLCQAHIRSEHPHVRASMERSNGSSDDACGGRSVNTSKVDLQSQLHNAQLCKKNSDSRNESAIKTTGKDLLLQQFTLQRNKTNNASRAAVASGSSSSNNNDSSVRNANEKRNAPSTSNEEKATSKAPASFTSSSVVYLPVLQKISQPVSVSFSLTPNSEQ